MNIEQQLYQALLEIRRLQQENSYLKQLLKQQQFKANETLVPVKPININEKPFFEKECRFSKIYFEEEMMSMLFGGNRKISNRAIYLLVHWNGRNRCAKNQL